MKTLIIETYDYAINQGIGIDLVNMNYKFTKNGAKYSIHDISSRGHKKLHDLLWKNTAMII